MQNYNDSLVVFVSYSRADTDVVDEIVVELEGRGYITWIDKRDLPYGEEWQAELADFIQRSDIVLWMVSPKSIGSRWVLWELGEVQRLNKKLIPLMVEQVDPETLPEALGKIHVLPANGIYKKGNFIEELIATLDTDHAWVKRHTRLADRAREWNERGQSSNQLLRGEALNDAENWRSQKRHSSLKPSSDVLELIAASQRGARGRLRAAAFGLLGVLSVTIGLGIVAWQQRNEAVAQRIIALEQRNTALLRESEVVAGNVQKLIAAKQGAEAFELARSVLPAETDGGDRPFSIKAEAALMSASMVASETVDLREGFENLLDVHPSPDGSFLVATTYSDSENRGFARLYGTDNLTNHINLGFVMMGPVADVLFFRKDNAVSVVMTGNYLPWYTDPSAEAPMFHSDGENAHFDNLRKNPLGIRLSDRVIDQGLTKAFINRGGTVHTLDKINGKFTETSISATSILATHADTLRIAQIAENNIRILNIVGPDVGAAQTLTFENKKISLVKFLRNGELFGVGLQSNNSTTTDQLIIYDSETLEPVGAPFRLTEHEPCAVQSSFYDIMKFGDALYITGTDGVCEFNSITGQLSAIHPGYVTEFLGNEDWAVTNYGLTRFRAPVPEAHFYDGSDFFYTRVCRTDPDYVGELNLECTARVSDPEVDRESLDPVPNVISPSGRYYLDWSDGDKSVIETSTGNTICSIGDIDRNITHIFDEGPRVLVGWGGKFGLFACDGTPLDDKEFRFDQGESRSGGIVAHVDVAAISKDGRTILTSGPEHTMKLWDTATAQLLWQKDFQDKQMYGFSANGRSYYLFDKFQHRLKLPPRLSGMPAVPENAKPKPTSHFGNWPELKLRISLITPEYMLRPDLDTRCETVYERLLASPRGKIPAYPLPEMAIRCSGLMEKFEDNMPVADTLEFDLFVTWSMRTPNDQMQDRYAWMTEHDISALRAYVPITMHN